MSCTKLDADSEYLVKNFKIRNFRHVISGQSWKHGFLGGPLGYFFRVRLWTGNDSIPSGSNYQNIFVLLFYV